MTAVVPSLLRIASMAAVAAAMFQSPTQTPPTFRSRSDAVAVPAVVRNGNAPVAGLRASDFELLDNGAPQTIDAVDVESVPVDVTLVIDTSGSMIRSIGDFKADVQAMAKLLRPADRIRVITFATGVSEMTPMQPASTPVDVRQLQSAGGTAVTDAMFYALAWPSESLRTHLVVAFTDGDDSVSVIEPSMLPTIADRADAVLHLVLPAWPARVVLHQNGITQSIDNPLPPSRLALIEAARRTGGEVHAMKGAVSALKEVLNDFKHSYVLRFAPSGGAVTGWHELTVRVVRAGGERFTVRARKGYIR